MGIEEKSPDEEGVGERLDNNSARCWRWFSITSFFSRRITVESTIEDAVAVARGKGEKDGETTAGGKGVAAGRRELGEDVLTMGGVEAELLCFMEDEVLSTGGIEEIDGGRFVCETIVGMGT